MFEHCGIDVEKIVGRKLSKEELDSLEKEILRRQRIRQKENAGESAEESLRMAAADAADDVVKEKLIAKRNEMLNMRARLHAVDYVQRHYGDNPLLGIQALLVGTNRARKGSRHSSAAQQNQKAQYYAQKFLSEAENTGFWPEFVSGAYDEEIAEVMWKIGRDEDISKHSDVAKSIGKVAHNWNEKARTDANKSGAWIGKQPGYIVRQSHDMYKIRGASRRVGGEATRDETINFEAWKNYILPLLDHERTFDTDDIDSFLKNTWEALSSGVHMAHTGGGDAIKVPSGFGSMAKRMSHDRVLHFKDGKSWSEYNKIFGTGSLRESMLYGLERMGKNTGLMESLGPNPSSNLDNIYRDIQGKIDGADAKTKFRDGREKIDNWMAELDGSINIPANALGARVGSNIRALQSMAKLGGAVISSITDIPNFASEMKYNGIGLLEGYGRALEGIVKGKPSKDQKQILGMIGVLSDSMAGAIVHKFSAADDLSGGMSRMMRTYFKFNGLTWWTDTMRSSAALSLSKNMADNAALSLDKIDADLRRVLDLFGIDEGQWNMMRVHLDEADGAKYLTPEAAQRIPDSELDDYLKAQGIEPTKTKRDNLRRETESKFRSYLIDRVEYAAIIPDARVSAAMKMGSRPGTVVGEFWRFIMQFKSFPTAVMTKPMARNIWGRGIEEDNFAKAMMAAMKSGNGEMLALAHHIVLTSVFGYMALAAKDMLKGRSPRNLSEKEAWFSAMAQGGGLGIYGDFLFGDMKNRFGGDALSTLAGPTAGTFTDIVDIIQRARDGDDVASATLRTVKSNAPFANLFYTQMALDYLVLYRIQEAMNPGYLRRMERRIEKENAQTFLIKPSEAVR